MSSRRDIAGFPICNTTADIFIRFLNHRLRRNRKTLLFFANANLVTRCGHLRAALRQDPDIYILNDGVALDAASWLLFGSAFRENLNGTDFTPSFLKHLDRPARVFLLGGTSEVVEKVASLLGQIPNVRIAGAADGYDGRRDEDRLIARLTHAKPDIVLVAMGNPLQEEWILKNRETIGASLIIGVGALFDFLSGTHRRAPEILRKLRLEWAHRLALEPRRLASRYTIGIVRFFAATILYDRRRSIS